jgi:hypothetical protein
MATVASVTLALTVQAATTSSVVCSSPSSSNPDRCSRLAAHAWWGAAAAVQRCTHGLSRVQLSVSALAHSSSPAVRSDSP